MKTKSPRNPVSLRFLKHLNQNNITMGIRVDALTNIVLAGHHQPLSVWMVCLYLMELNLSKRQIVGELSMNRSDVQKMTQQLRHWVNISPLLHCSCKVRLKYNKQGVAE